VQNRKVDEARFHGVLTETNVLVAVEAGFDFAPTEAPGAYDVGGTWTFTAGKTVDDAGRHWTPRGTVQKLSDGSMLINSLSGESGYTWNEGDPAVKLTWRWVRPGFAIYIR
jgi:hypothetical protein